MGTFELARTIAATPERVFDVVGDLRGYARFMPLTAITTDTGPITPGWEFEARSGIGRARVPDRMRVSDWDPPRGFRVVKLGPVLDGWAEVHLTGEGNGTRVVWREEITLRPAWLGRRLAPLSDRLNVWLFGRALDRMAARAAARAT